MEKNNSDIVYINIYIHIYKEREREREKETQREREREREGGGGGNKVILKLKFSDELSHNDIYINVNSRFFKIKEQNSFPSNSKRRSDTKQFFPVQRRGP